MQPPEIDLAKLDAIIEKHRHEKWGLIPLLQDVFFVNMSITIMAGLGFATVLTLVFVPTLYSILFRVRVPAGQGE